MSKKSKGVDGKEFLPFNEVNFPALKSPQRKMGGGNKRVQNHSPLPLPQRVINLVQVINPLAPVDLAQSPKATSLVGSTTLFEEKMA